MKYSDLISINQNFQSSVNLELDLNNNAKINEYIPTSDICDVLKKYFKTFLNYDQNHSTILEGPYGKGKSFLLLVLTYLTGKKEKDSTYYGLLEKIKKIDEELVALINQFDDKKYKYLPIIINSTYDNLSQSFLLALNDALSRGKLNDVIPTTAYSVCLEILDKWEHDNAFNDKVQKECLKQNKSITIEKLRKGLKKYDPNAYRQFESLYNCVSMGLNFNPLINNDITKIYADIVTRLQEFGYTGIFVIFDEFSKFLESSDNDLPKHLKLIQDFAERANRSSKNEQINFCCVTHKSFEMYANKRKEDAFKTVQGRFKEIRFNRSLSENYQIISSAIKKKNITEINKRVEQKKPFYSELAHTDIFKNINSVENIFAGCYPLNPVTVFMLIRLSEIVAQNERTLFTFLSDTDENSFNSFIHNNGNGLFNVDKIYDYFNNSLKKEELNGIRTSWYRSEAILSHLTDITDRKIIKAIAILLMINESDVCPQTIDMLSLSLDTKKDIITNRVEKLIEKHYLRRSPINQLISFASANSKEIDEQIELVSKIKLKSLSYTDLLGEIDENKYVLPRRYNENYKITRFYSIVYLTEEQFTRLNSFETIKEKVFCDGLIVNLIREQLNESEIIEIMNKINDKTVVVRFPKNKVDTYFNSMVYRYAALKEIIQTGDNNEIVTSELELLKEETLEDLKELREKYYDSDYDFYTVSYPKESNFNNVLSSTFELIYNKTIRFNNELVNKNTISSQYQKAVNHVGDLLLANTQSQINELYSETSPEKTVYVSIVRIIEKDTIAKHIINEIKTKIRSAEGSKILFSEIYDKYISAPYGIRRGVISLLICYAIGELSDNVILYQQKTEIELNSNNIAKAVYSKSKYYFGFDKGSGDQNDFVYNLLKLLEVNPTGNFRQDVKKLCDSLRRFFMGLPLIIRSGNVDDIMIPDNIKSYSKYYMVFDINPTETVLEKSIAVFGDYRIANSVLSDFII